MERQTLWEKESNGSYTNIFRTTDQLNGDVWHTYLNDIEQCPKNSKFSLEGRLKGNAEVQKKMWRIAMESYNRSLCYAEIGSQHVSLAYANRSLCFLKLEMYDKCLIDIELAINAKYPEQLMSKLEERRTFCLNQIKNGRLLKKDEVKLDYEEDKHFPGMANVVQMTCNEKFGRHLIAKCDVDVGKIILIDEAFVTIRMNAAFSVCGNCLKNTMNLIACSKCSNTMFCSQECAENDKLHEINCNDAIVYRDQLVASVNRSILLALNIFPNTDNLIGFVENIVSDTKNEALEPLGDMQSKYRAFLKLNLWIYPEEILDLHIRVMPAFHRLMTKPAIQAKIRSTEDQRFLMHLMMMHAVLIKCNSFQHNMTGGIFLIQNHINHSCAPNLIHYMHSNKSTGLVSRLIKKEDQIFITYGAEKCYFEPRIERQQYLWKDFGFQCDCEKCSNNNWPVSSERMRSDPDYKYLLHQMYGKEIDYTDKSKCYILKQTCLVILKKYRDMPWTTEFDSVSCYLARLLTETSLHF